MTVPALLLAFLGAAIGLAGFAGLLVSIDRSTKGTVREVASIRVHYLVFMALAVLVFAAAPLLAILLGGGSAVWQVGSAIVAAVLLVCVVRTVTLRRDFLGSDARRLRLRASYVMAALGFMVAALLVAGAGGYASASASYATGVFWFLLGEASLFAHLVFTLDESLRDRDKGQ